MAESKITCYLCKHSKLTKLAKIWCRECEDGLCYECQNHHEKQTSSKYHTFISIEDYQKLPLFIRNIKLNCEDHNEKYQHYCMTHERPLCKKCVKASHEKCSDVKMLDDVIRNVKTSFALERAVDDVKCTMLNLQRVIQDRRTNCHDITQEKEDIVTNIKQIRKEVNKRLDQLEEKLILELNTTYKDALSPIEHLIQSIEAKEKEFINIDDKISTIKKYASNFQTFIGLKRIESSVQDEKVYLTNLIEGSSLGNIKLSFVVDDNLQKFIDNVRLFGNIQILNHKKSFLLEEPKLTGLQIAVLKDSDLQFKREIQLKDGLYRGCCTLSNGNVVLVNSDGNPNHFSEYNSEGLLLSTFPLKGAKHIVPIDDCKVVVSNYVNNQLNIIDMNSKQIIQNINKTPLPVGITFKDNKIIFCSRKKGIKSCCLQTHLIEDIYTDDTVDFNSNCTVLQDGICYTSPDVNTVTVLDSMYHLLFKFRDDEFIRDPRGVAVNQQNNIYVAGYDSDNIVVISPDGKKRREILNKENNGLNGPHPLYVDKKTKQLLVTDASKVLRFYEFS